MTKKLETLFNLPEITAKENKQTGEKIKERKRELEQSYREIDAISASLPAVGGLGNATDKELDALAAKAEQAYDDLMDLGMNVESRYSGRLFEVASSFLKNAIDAKAVKIDKKLKMVELQLKKLKIDRETNEENPNTLDGNGFIITDRNELLKKLGEKE